LRVRNYFERTADNFDALYDDRHNWQYYFNRVFRKGLFQRVEKTLEVFRHFQDFTVLDVGCGSGRNSVLFLEAGARRVVGVDFAPRMLDLAREHSQAKGVAERCEFIEADFLTYSFSESFDIVVALGVFDYVADPVSVLGRMARLSRGKVVASFPGVSPVRAPVRKVRYALKDCPLYFYTAGGLQRLCSPAGLAQFRIERIASGYMLVGSPTLIA